MNVLPTPVARIDLENDDIERTHTAHFPSIRSSCTVWYLQSHVSELICLETTMSRQNLTYPEFLKRRAILTREIGAAT